MSESVFNRYGYRLIFSRDFVGIEDLAGNISRFFWSDPDQQADVACWLLEDATRTGQCEEEHLRAVNAIHDLQLRREHDRNPIGVSDAG